MKRSKKISLMILAPICFGAGILFWRACPPTDPGLNNRFHQAPDPLGRVLIVSPHPDDESLACAGVIEKAVNRSIPVKVVLMTNGDGYFHDAEVFYKTLSPTADNYRNMGFMRREETIRAMRKLGLSQKDIIFLSYPDGGLNSLWTENWDHNRPHVGLNGNMACSYPFAFQPGASYSGLSIVDNLSEIIKEFRPTMVYYPDSSDFHHDHWATGAFVQYALIENGYSGIELTYLVHQGDWPTPWRLMPERALYPPPALEGIDTYWEIMPLDKKQVERKESAIREYHSQEQLMGPFLNTFVRRNELFGVYKPRVIAQMEIDPNPATEEWRKYVVLRDPPQDTFGWRSEEGGDIRSVAFCLGKERAWLGLEARKTTEKKILYVFHLRLFENSYEKRLDLAIHDGRATATRSSKDSILIAERIKPVLAGNKVWISIPRKIVSDANVCLLNVDTFLEGHRIDKTAWRKLII
jgi:LmbE family N-acetylglucosaminyl deacetylase